MINRRFLLQGVASVTAMAAQPGPAAAAIPPGLKFGPPAPFSFESLKAQARELARTPFRPPPRPSSEILEKIDYEQHGKIKYRTDLALWAQGPGDFPVTFFHLGRFFQSPVRMHAVEDGAAREIVYQDACFDMPADSPARGLPDNSGFAGFRFQESRSGRLDWRRNDWVAFLGASYFRAIGELNQYGLSARGVALDAAVFGAAEEFPSFTQVYFETPTPGQNFVTVCALLDGPSIAGAFRFVMRRDRGVTMEVDTALYLRRDVERFGVAPLTSMYWYSEKAKPTSVDWRPEIHDSDGLALWTSTGERIWRPLNNPPRTTASAFGDQNPRGFGLMQRDRAFDHYLDGVRYERRPSLWIEPLGEWGRGSVQLVEIPTDDEIHDNIVAMWVPDEPARAGSAHGFRYRMHWVADEPAPPALARCVATRFGNGGQAGTARPKGVRKFVVEFRGDALTGLATGALPDAVLSTSRGVVSNIRTEAVPNDVPGHWRAEFDLSVTGDEPVEIRCYLRLGEAILSETWLYQYHPPF